MAAFLNCDKMTSQIWIVFVLCVLNKFTSPQSLKGDLITDANYRAYHGDCNLYYETLIRSCPTNSFWVPELQRCESENRKSCDTATTSPNPQAEPEESLAALCAGQQGAFIQYPDDCTRFIQCDYRPFVKTCPPFLYWNSKLLTCDKICV